MQNVIGILHLQVQTGPFGCGTCQRNRVKDSRLISHSWCLAGGAKIWSLASVPDETLIIGGTERGEVVLWSTAESVPLGTFRGDDEPVWSVSVGPDGDQLWSGGWDGVARRWDIRRTQACTHENAYVFTDNSGIN